METKSPMMSTLRREFRIWLQMMMFLRLQLAGSGLRQLQGSETRQK